MGSLDVPMKTGPCVKTALPETGGFQLYSVFGSPARQFGAAECGVRIASASASTATAALRGERRAPRSSARTSAVRATAKGTGLGPDLLLPKGEPASGCRWCGAWVVCGRRSCRGRMQRGSREHFRRSGDGCRISVSDSATYRRRSHQRLRLPLRNLEMMKHDGLPLSPTYRRESVK
jgi:hypothetical protein